MTEDTDPTPPSAPNSTDPIFPPKLGKGGPKDVSVTAVQGPGVDASAAAETTTTERLLSGLLEVPGPDVKTKPRKRETSGEREAGYAVSPRPVPVARKVKDAEGIIVAAGGAKYPSSSPTMDLPGGDAEGGKRNVARGTRDDVTVPLPRSNDKRGAVAFVVALLLVGAVGWLVLGRTSAPLPTTPTGVPTPATAQVPTVAVTALPVDPLAAPPPTATTDDNTVQADPVIESQALKRPRAIASGRSSGTPSAQATAVGTAVPPASTATPLAVDSDELKKSIKH